MISKRKKRYSTIILSILVGKDFSRDQLSYRSGFPRPAVIKNGNNISWSSIPDKNKTGTIFNPFPISILRNSIIFFYERSIIIYKFFDKFNFNITGDRLTEKHIKAAPVENIISWTLAKFSAIKVPRKIILLQYTKMHNNGITLKERRMILKISKQLDLDIVDTFNIFDKYKSHQIWMGHHTPFGNEIVCNYLFEKAFKNQN